MKILLTGSNGLVGKNVNIHAKKHNYDLLTPSRKDVDLLDYSQLEDYIAKNSPDLVIHAAGLVGGIQANMDNPVKFLVDNMQMGINTIMASSNNGVKKFINLSSSCMYPKEATNPLNENMILTGLLEPTNEGYALAKITSTKLCEYISRENANCIYKTVIPCNLYGCFDKFDPHHSHMIPAVIRKIHEAKKNNQPTIDIWGDGKARREFMYVEDLADFLFYSIPRLQEMPQNINVGLGRDYSINEYYQEIANVIGYKGEFVHDLTKPIGMKQKLIDDTRLKNFGWSSKTTLTKGIEKTYEFYLGGYSND